MRWTELDEKQLQDLIANNKSIDEIATALNRSPEAIFMKLTRLGVAIPQRSFVENMANKVTESATTTQMPKLEIAKLEELPTGNEAIGLLWAALRRLQEPDVSKDEAKKLRLVIQGVKSYIHLEADYLVRMRRIESEALSEWRHLAASWKIQLNRAKRQKTKPNTKSYSAAPKSISKCSLKQVLKRLKNSRRLIDLSMTKKEIDDVLENIKSLANKAESILSRNDKRGSVEKSTFSAY
jgi:IS30 family transposase